MIDAMILTLGQSDAPPVDASPSPGPSAPGPDSGGGTGAQQQPTITQPGGAQPTQEGGGGGGFDGSGMLLMLLLFIVIMYVFIFGSQRKEKKKRASMLDALKKNDKVVTIGGIMGTVVEVKPSEVVLKVDESSNTRLKFARTAIQSIISEDADKVLDNKNDLDKK